MITPDYINVINGLLRFHFHLSKQELEALTDEEWMEEWAQLEAVLRIQHKNSQVKNYAF